MAIRFHRLNMRNDQHFTRGFAGHHLVLPLTQHGINSLDPGFALFSGGVEFIEQAAGAEFWEGVNGKQRAVMLFQRIAAGPAFTVTAITTRSPARQRAW